ncbi:MULTISPECIES: hypothetical protein [Bacteria]|uniref:hypothetical protein n=1 Tax=Bacteria TaxID=2 RepID=UPI003C7D2EF1
MRSRSGSLDPDVALGIKIGATISRDRYETDPAEIQRIIDDIYRIAGDRLDILAHEVGLFIGAYEDEHTLTLTTALRKLPLDMADAIALGAYRRSVPMHSSAGHDRD